jgi:hypothetical protein
MILISHRGNINGRFESWENEPTYIDLAIQKGYDVEIDVWCVDGIIWLGHDKPLYGGLSINWFLKRANKLWIHCKNIEALEYFKNFTHEINYFWHENDRATVTSKIYIISHVDQEPIEGSIAMMPEKHNFDVSKCVGVCSDYIEKYKTDDTTNIRD